MKKIIITIEASTRFHNGQNYEYFPAVEIDITDESGNIVYTHTSVDIHGATGHGTIEEAQQVAEVFLSSNVKAVGRAIISEVNE
jgi:hypothetical protein